MIAATDQLLITRDVLRVTRWSRATLDRRIRRGEFPPPMRISPRGRRWIAGEVNAWLEARRAEAMERQQAQVAAAS